MWQVTCEPKAHYNKIGEVKSPSKIIGYRIAEYSDLPTLERMIGMKTRTIFGDVNVGRIFENSCMTIVQFNEELDIVSGVSLCNYPNVPSVPSSDWFNWITVHYGITDITPWNTMFIHLLVWDSRYMEIFFGNLLTAIFEMATSCMQVFLVFPPWRPPVDVLEQHMSRIVPQGMKNTYTVQALYRGNRSKKFKIRRAVEEDNDDLVLLINSESNKLKELYGEFYISEIICQPDSCRQLIVSEDENGAVTGVMCLNRNVDIDLLNENFELAPYNGLRKPHVLDKIATEEETVISGIVSYLFHGLCKILDRNECFDIKNKQRNGIDENGRDYIENRITQPSPAFNDTLMYKTISVGSSIDNMQININRANKKREFGQENEQRIRTKSVTPNDDTNFLTLQKSLDSDVTYHRKLSAKTTDLRCLTMSTEISDDSRSTLLNNKTIEPCTKIHKISVDSDSLLPSTLIRGYNIKTGRSFLCEANVKSSENLDFMSNLLRTWSYHGEINAFVLELFTTRKNIGEHYTRDFLEAAFECVPHLDYCIILLPSTQPTLPFLKHFVRVPLQCNKDFPMVLYVTHRIVFSSEINSRLAKSGDRNSLQQFLSRISETDTLLADFEETVNNNHKIKSCCIFECEEVIVGVCIICTENYPDVMRKRYHIEDYILKQCIPREEYGRILHFVVMPIFLIQSDFIFCEIMRLSGMAVVYYRLYENDASALTRTCPLATCLNFMMPVTPRKKFEFKYNEHRHTENNQNVCETECTINADPFALFLTTRKLARHMRQTINMKIIIVGASDCGLALAEYLALGPLYNSAEFTNLTIISPNGLPFEKKFDCAVAKMLPFRGRYCHEYMRLIAPRLRINVVYGSVVEINRKEKYVTVLNQGNLTYDFLILTCGMQYGLSLFNDNEPQQKRKLDERQIHKNYFNINNDVEAFHFLKNILLLTTDFTEEKKIVFYGHNIDCYCALNGLLEFGVNGSWITLIEPTLNPCETHDHVFFNDCEIDTAVTHKIFTSGVEILSGWNVVDWNVEESDYGRAIKSINLESKAQFKNISCDVFINFSKKAIDEQIFLAITRAGFIFDGQLVIDPEFRTNDPYVFAAGTITKYSRKFQADCWEHKYYNSIEVGERLGKIIRKVIDQHHADGKLPTVFPKDRFYLTLPVFRAPIIVFCTLPGGYHYLHVRKPGKIIPRNIVIANYLYGNVMATGFTTSEIGFFRIRLNTYDSVETITCYRKEKFEVQNMISLYGKHEKLLNDLKNRFEKSFILDFFAYFREPYFAAIFYDKFECLRVENRATLLSKMDTMGHEQPLIDDCLHVLLKSNWQMISENDRRYIDSRYAGSLYQTELERNLFDFLQYAEDDLPMYWSPQLLRDMYQSIQDSPLFSDQ